MDLVIGLVIVTIFGVVGLVVIREGVEAVSGRAESRYSRGVTIAGGVWAIIFGTGLAIFAVVTLALELT